MNPGHREISRFVSWHHLDYAQILARACVDAAQGGVSEAIATTLSAAEIGRADGRVAAEVIVLQTASSTAQPRCADDDRAAKRAKESIANTTSFWWDTG